MVLSEITFAVAAAYARIFFAATGYVASQNGEKDFVPVLKRIFPAVRGAQGVQVVTPRRLGEVI